jgi:hypothetical protein
MAFLLLAQNLSGLGLDVVADRAHGGDDGDGYKRGDLRIRLISVRGSKLNGLETTKMAQVVEGDT